MKYFRWEFQKKNEVRRVITQICSSKIYIGFPDGKLKIYEPTKKPLNQYYKIAIRQTEVTRKYITHIKTQIFYKPQNHNQISSYLWVSILRALSKYYNIKIIWSRESFPRKDV